MAAPSDDLNAVAATALQFIKPGSVVGLGTGRAATVFIHALGAKVATGLKVLGVPTSVASEKLAKELGIPLATLDDVDTLDVDVDGADEVDPHGNLIKGYGGALLREKVVAAASKRVIILVGPEKEVPVLGSRGVIPVEVIPFAQNPCAKKLSALGLVPRLRIRDGKILVTDNGNHILDCDTKPITDPTSLARSIAEIPGVVDTGLFLNMQPTVIIGKGDQVTVRGPGI